MNYHGDTIFLSQDKTRLLDGFVKVDQCEVFVPQEMRGRKYLLVTTTDAVAVVVTVKETGKIILVRQPRPAAGEFLWEIPAGKIDKGEEPWQTAKREVQEETGFKCRHVRFLRSFYPSPGVSTEKIYLFHAVVSEAEDFVGQELDADEFIEVRHFDPEEIRSLEIKDGKTILGLTLFRPVLIL